MGIFGPDWWHSHGSKMSPRPFDESNQILRIEGSAAFLEISLIGLSTGVRWLVKWEVRQSQNEKSSGSVIFTDDDMVRAFGIKFEDNEIPSGHGWLYKHYLCESGRQRKFIRWEDYLNIPCPGTGHDGDPNVSMEVTHEIRMAVVDFMALKEGAEQATVSS